MKILAKYYSQSDDRFYIDVGEYMFKTKTLTFDDFKSFIDFLEGDIKDANLLDYDFEGIDLKKYNYEDALISTSVLKAQGLFDDSFFNSNISVKKDLLEIKSPTENAVTISRTSDITSYDSTFDVTKKGVAYISDIHLDHKIASRFPKAVSKNEVKHFIKSIVTKISSSFKKLEAHKLLVVGDVSFNFKISKIFYRLLRETIPYSDIYVILGNHELWDSSLVDENTQEPIDSIISKYRLMLEDLSITLINNELTLEKSYPEPIKSFPKVKLSEDEILRLSDEELMEYCKNSHFIMLGGIGFSGFLKEFNATHGVYRDIIKDIDEEKHYTVRFENLYKKCKRVLGHEELIIATHMPKNAWSKDDYCGNWIYVNGHTHRNFFINDEDRTVYADNQIGYSNNTFELKQFWYEFTYDIFEDFQDGIHEISKEDYMAFYRGRGKHMKYSNKNTKIFMLKKRDIYCFIQKHKRSEKFSLLNGGLPKHLKYQNSLRYYYNNLDNYANAVEHIMHEYNKKLKEISTFVKSLGGSGRIHGAIVDIDFYNHLYLNPLSGQVVPYFATSMVDKYVYKNIESLLYYKNKKLYDKYKNLLENKKTSNPLKSYKGNHLEVSPKNNPKPYKKTDIYKFSKLALDFQYVSKIKVVRVWIDEVNEKSRNKEKGYSLLVKSLS